jgi:hypothetical protein
MGNKAQVAHQGVVEIKELAIYLSLPDMETVLDNMRKYHKTQ